MKGKYVLIVSFLSVVSTFFLCGVFAQEASETEISFGASQVFNTASTSQVSLAALSDAGFVLAYRDGLSNLNQGKVIVGTVSDAVIDFGEAYQFNAAATNYVAITLLAENKFAVAYQNKGNADYGTIRIGQVSGKEISLGDPYIFNNGATDHISMARLSDGKALIAYQNRNSVSKQGEAAIVEIDGLTVSFGQGYVFNGTATAAISVLALSDAKAVIVYQDDGVADYGAAVVADVSGTALAFGSETVFNASATSKIVAANLSGSKFLAAYQDGSLNYGRGAVGEVSGDDIVFGGEYVFNPSGTSNISAVKLKEDKAALAYQDIGGSSYGRVIVVLIDGRVISFGEEYVFNTAKTGNTGLAALSANKVVAGYQNGAGNLNYGQVLIGQVSGAAEVVPEPEPEPASESDSAGTAVPDTSEQEQSVDTGAVALSDGDLIRNSSAEGMAQFDIYIVKLVGTKKFKRLILSPHVFASYAHLRWEDIKEVDQSVMNQYTSSDLVRAAGDDKVYKLTADGDLGTKQWLNMTAEVFLASYDADSIYEINDTDRDAYTLGSDL